MNGKLICGIFAAGLAVFSAGTVAADDYHYTNLLIGDRASGMGGAYTAVSDDATGLYYNPAGVAYAAGRSVNASVNAYYNTEKTYKSVIGGNGWVRKSSSLLPNYFGVVQPVGAYKIGFSYAVPESIMENQDQTFHDLPLNAAIQPFNPGKVTSYIINFNNESNVYNFGPSIARELNSKVAVGLSLYYYQKRTMWILNQFIKTDNPGVSYEWTNDKYLLNEWGFRPVLGFMYTPVDNVSVGLAVSKVFIEGSNTMFQHTSRRENIAVDSNPSNSNAADLPDGQRTDSTKREYPTQVSLGVAWFPSQSLLLSCDIKHYTAVSAQNVEAVDNLALGAEYYLSKNWAVRGGLLTDYANTPAVTSNAVNQNEHIDLYGGSLSISHFTRNTSVTLGSGYTAGSGKAQIIGGSTRVQDAELSGWMFFLSSSYSY